MKTVQELINELSQYPKDTKVYTDHVYINLSNEIVLKHVDTDEEKRKREEEIDRISRKWKEEFERGEDMPTFASRW